MKKIMGAVLAAAMLAGTVTATDIGFSYTVANLFQTADKTGSGNGENARYLGAHQCLSVSLTTDAAGFVVDYDADNADLMPDEYYGWMNFDLPLGSLQVTAGAWNGRNVNRVVADRYDLDATNVEGFGLFELYKPGVINGTVGYDSANLTLGNIGLVGAWTLADVLPGTLMVKLGLARYYTRPDGWNHNAAWTQNSDGGTAADKKYIVTAKNKWAWNPDYDSFTVKAGPLAEVSYWQEGAFRANLSVRSLNKHSYSFGAWISPELADTVQMTIGGTVATMKLWKDAIAITEGKDDATGADSLSNQGSWSDRTFEWGIDFRLRLQVTDDLSLTTMHNLSSGKTLKSTQTASGTYDIADGWVTQGKLWNMLNATYAFADNLKASFTVNSEADVFCPAYKSGQWDLTLTPALIIQASERARVTAAVRGKAEDIHNFALKNITLHIPVVFSFNY